MLPRLRILQVGDVHLPGQASAKPSIDDKDPRFPSDLRQIIAERPIKKVFQRLYKVMESEQVDALLFMGDLTDVGKLSGYEACAKYIRNALQIGVGEKFGHLPVGIVPGNHDIDRELAKKPGLIEKFNPLQIAIQKETLPALPVLKPVWLAANRGVANARIGLLNSCWGCGAREYIPIEFRDSVAAAIDSAIGTGANEKTVRAYYDRQFDTPAFRDDTVEELAALPNSANELLVVAAHHNILPQRLPRLAPYTELVNSGVMRSMLSGLQRPVLYLHGHIHEDPVELVQSPGGDPLICVSAPEAAAGFNVLELTFTKVGIPLSLRIVRWRFTAAAVLRPAEPQIVSLIGRRRRSFDRTLSQLYSAILDKRELYWPELSALALKIYSDEVESQLEEGIEVLAADGRVQIENYDGDRAGWIVGATL